MENIVDNTEGSIPLRPKARILKTLGQELISSETVAIIELVKNAYDADAKNVLIKFEGELVEGAGNITVFDDGHGMNISTVKDAWMVIATSNKKHSTRSKSGSRRVLGEKGIGRFASTRLAKELELISREIDSNEEVYAFFDWAQFDDESLFLDEILFLTEERQAQEIVDGWVLDENTELSAGGCHGTILRMSALNHTWEKRDFDELQRGLSRLVSPFQSEKNFNIEVELPSDKGLVRTEIESPQVLNYPHYQAKGELDNEGVLHIEVSIEASGEETRNEWQTAFYLSENQWQLVRNESKELNLEDPSYRNAVCGPFKFEIRAWDRDELESINQMVGSGIRAIRKDLDAVAGVNVYRDGFRVLPYGEPGDDWLRLDMRRVQNPTRNLSNNQITGYISISADDNPDLRDRSNREGMDNNLAFSDLREIMLQILVDLETERAKSKRPRKTSRDNQNDPQPGLFDPPDFTEIRSSVASGHAEPEKTLALVASVESRWRRQITSLKTVLSQYHGLATLGGIVDKVLHEGRQPLSIIQTQAGLGERKANNLLQEASNDSVEIPIETGEKFKNYFGKIIFEANVMHDVFRRVEPFGGRKRGRPKKYYIEEIIKQNFDLYENEIKRKGIKVHLPESQTLVSLDVSELSEIITNLITNSLHWLTHVPEEKRSIDVQVTRKKTNEVEILFSDTGPGINSNNRDQVFDPYFSTKPDGHGLGLALVGEIVRDYYNGSVELLDSGPLSGAVFRIVLRRRV